MNTEEAEKLANVINSQEAVAVVANLFEESWPMLKAILEKAVGRPFGEIEEDKLYQDLHDWWKNGNFYVWAPGEKNAFGMTGWEWGDPDFWEETE